MKTLLALLVSHAAVGGLGAFAWHKWGAAALARYVAKHSGPAPRPPSAPPP